MSTETREREREVPVRINIHDWPPLGITGPIEFVRADVADALLAALQACEENLRLTHEAAGPLPKGAPMPSHSTFGAWELARAAIRKATGG